METTINGIGERAGNAAMEELVMALKTRNDVLKADTGIVTTEIMRASKLLSSITGVKVQPTKPSWERTLLLTKRASTSTGSCSINPPMRS